MRKVLGKRDACGGGGTVDTDDLCSLADGLKEEVRFAGCVSVVGTGGCSADWLKPACCRELKALKWCHPCLILSYFTYWKQTSDAVSFKLSQHFRTDDWTPKAVECHSRSFIIFMGLIYWEQTYYYNIFSQEKFSYNFIFLHSRESHIFWLGI